MEIKNLGEREINIKEIQAIIIVGFIKRIIKISASMLQNKSYFSDRISYLKYDLINSFNHNTPISNKQKNVELLVTGVYISYLNSISGKCDFLYDLPDNFKDDEFDLEERVKYDMHKLFNDGHISGYFNVVNNAYTNLVEEEKLIPSAITITCYDKEKEHFYEISPIINNIPEYEKIIEDTYRDINEYFERFDYFDKEEYLNENSYTTFINSYDSMLKELSSNEEYVKVFTNLIKKGIFEEVFNYLQKEKENLIETFETGDKEILNTLKVKIYSYLEKKEMSERFENVFADDEIISLNEKTKRRRL